jgi:hypothetical protein
MEEYYFEHTARYNRRQKKNKIKYFLGFDASSLYSSNPSKIDGCIKNHKDFSSITIDVNIVQQKM